jgi:peroxiredoxin
LILIYACQFLIKCNFGAHFERRVTKPILSVMNKLIFLFFLGVCTASFGQQIKFKISNAPTDTVYLVRHFGNKRFYADTAIIKKEYAIFNGVKHKEGLMTLYFVNAKALDFLNVREEVEIHADYATMSAETAVVKKSNENKVFFSYLAELMKATKERQKIMDNGKNDKELKELNDRMKIYLNKFAQDHATTLAGKFVKMGIEIDIPEAPKNPDGSIADSSFAFKYYRSHFFDNIDFKDDRLVNFGVFEQRLDLYFSQQMMIQLPDTVLHYAYDLLGKFDKKSDMFRFTLEYLIQKYEKSKIMGHDKIYVMLGVKYYCDKLGNPNPEITWLSTEKIKPFCERVWKLQHLVVGAKPHNLSLMDSTSTKWISLYDVKAEYTILYFWDPECGHCKKETPRMAELYNEKLKKRNVEVYAVGKATGEEFDKWKKFIQKNNMTFINVAITHWLWEQANKDPWQFIPKHTNVQSLQYQDYFDVYSNPKVFVLDKDKKIIAKNLSLAQIEEFLDRLQGVPDAPKMFPVEKEEKAEDH